MVSHHYAVDCHGVNVKGMAAELKPYSKCSETTTVLADLEKHYCVRRIDRDVVSKRFVNNQQILDQARRTPPDANLSTCSKRRSAGNLLSLILRNEFGGPSSLKAAA
jgi:hypothetical protein